MHNEPFIVSASKRFLARSGRWKFIRYISIQVYLILVALFNFLLHLLPFTFWKRSVAFVFGVRLGKRVSLCKGVRFLALGKCKIGERTVVNRNCLLDNRGSISIANDVSIATGTSIFTEGHDINDANFISVRSQVRIQSHVCIFSNVSIMPGVELGFGSVVYPNSVVTNSVHDRNIIAGTPAKVIGKRSLTPDYHLDSDYWFN